MKTSTVVFIALGVAVAGFGVYMIVRKPDGAPAARAPAQPQAPAGYAQGGNSTANTVSQWLGVGQQAASIFGSVSNTAQSLSS